MNGHMLHSSSISSDNKVVKQVQVYYKSKVQTFRVKFIKCCDLVLISLSVLVCVKVRKV